MKRLSGDANLGLLLTPNNRNSVRAAVATGLPWAIDNGAFSGFDADRFRRLLSRVADQPRCLFVVCPDVVADHTATLARFDEWRAEVAATGQPIAFVAQDGVAVETVPWDRIDALFIGGSTAFKLSQTAADVAQEAKRLGKHVHMGRVNSRRRLEAAALMGCDSVDGTSMSMYGDKYIHKFCAWARQIENQAVLW